MTTDPRVAREMAHLFAACVPQPLTPGQQAILDAVPLREPGPFDIFQSWPTRPDPDPVEEVLGRMAASTSTVSATPPATLDLAALEKVLADIPPEPIGEWMREQGFPPETSLAILPETMRSQLPIWPSYVRFSLGVTEPTLARRPEVGHPAWMNGWRK